MDPDQTITAASDDVAVVYVIGVLFLGTCVVFLLFCASSSHRKKRRQVEDGKDGSGNGVGKRSSVSGNKVRTHGRKWRENPKKQQKKKEASGLVNKFPVITIVITPPSPSSHPRSGNKATDDPPRDPAQETTSENATTQNDAKGHDVTCDENGANISVSYRDSGNKMSSSSTSLSGIGDVNFVTSGEVTSERGEDLPPEQSCFRPRLASLECGASKSDYRIIHVDQSAEIRA